MATLAQPPAPAIEQEETSDLPLTLHLPGGADMDDRQFIEFCRLNEPYGIEQAASGEIIVMSPLGGATGYRESEIGYQLVSWSKRDGTGVVFTSDTLFKLPNGGRRGPDAAWIQRRRLAGLTPEESEGLLPVVPDFIVELISPSDRVSHSEAKMRMWIELGVRLAWMIDPKRRTVEVYREDGVQTHENPATVSGDPVLLAFVLDLEPIWSLDW